MSTERRADGMNIPASHLDAACVLQPDSWWSGSSGLQHVRLWMMGFLVYWESDGNARICGFLQRSLHLSC